MDIFYSLQNLYYNTQMCHVFVSQYNNPCSIWRFTYVYQIYFRFSNLLDASSSFLDEDDPS